MHGRPFFKDAGESATLIARARAGSNSSLGKLLANCHGYLLLVANREVDRDLRAKIAPSDVAQETFLIAQQKFSSFEGTSEHELRSWLRQILINRYKDMWREYKATSQRSADREVHIDEDRSMIGMLLADDQETPSTLAAVKENLAALEKALARLPAEHRTVVEMRNWDRLTFVEIGRRLGKSPDAVRKTWVRAIERLVDEL